MRVPIALAALMFVSTAYADPPNQTCTTQCAAGQVCSSNCLCNAGWGDCDGLAANGCETNLFDDPDHCGACAVACPRVPGQVALCRAGACTTACDPNASSCVPNPLQSCGDTSRDPNNCGACGVVCPYFAPACVHSVCTTFALVATWSGGSISGWPFVAGLDSKVYFGNPSNTGAAQFFQSYDVVRGTFAAEATNGELCACGYMGTLTGAAGRLYYFANGGVAYDPGTRAWSGVNYPWDNHRGEAATAAWAGRIYLVGGRGSGNYQGAQVFDLATEAWSPIADAPFAVYAAGAAALGGRVYVFGGWSSGTLVPSSEFASYDVATGAWTTLAASPHGIGSYPSVAVAGSRFYALSGAVIYSYDTRRGLWDPAPIPAPPGGQNWRLVNAGPYEGMYLVGDSATVANTVLVYQF